MGLNNDGLRQLADHMGHDLQIHVNHYALQSELVERAKVAKVLTAIFNGSLSVPDRKANIDSMIGDVLTSHLVQQGEIQIRSITLCLSIYSSI